ncbi:TetR-like C-terminal domain-containing protein [Herbiconiux ginsengi]|uniref:Transcriptional regulator, TetR family n=1 Tax=Herbiconiux ginsengi TaxID=381665 RepID=A0A1H3LLT2_9MICO|nr:TetR-like C-terminal domain-containing protein [Herbiconiux ginsengi]SDY65260.1 transcriptional regulator, TetR family [Herbiconiux ginsengi]
MNTVSTMKRAGLTVMPSDASDSSTPPTDRRIRRTLSALNAALLTLLEQRELADITVANIAEQANISRSTFYDHYQDVHELAEAACTSLIDELVESLPSPRPDAVDEDGPRALESFFEHLRTNAGLYRNLLGANGSARLIDHVRRRITAAVRAGLAGATTELPGAHPGTAEVEVRSAFSAGALTGVAVDWLDRGCPETPRSVARMCWNLLSGALADT